MKYLIGAILCGLVALGLLFPILMPKLAPSELEICRSNLMDLSMSARIYMSENDGRLPPANWYPLLMRYPRMYGAKACPSAPQHGYAMNSALLGRKLSFRSPEILFFEVGSLQESLIEPWPAARPRRHKEGIHIVRVGGQVELLAAEQLP